MPSETRKNIHYVPQLDLVRVLAIVGVVFIHAFSYVVRSEPDGSYGWWLSNFFNMFFRWSVPAFFIISGYLVIPKLLSAGNEYYQKRLMRILLPLLFWNGAYLLYNLSQGAGLSTQLVELFSHGYSYYHLYFLTSLSLITLVLPFIVPLWPQSKRAHYGMLGGLFLMTGLSVYIHEWHYWHLPYTYWTAPLLWIPFLGYVILGGLMADSKTASLLLFLKRLKTAVLVGAILILSLVMTLGYYFLYGTYSWSGRGLILESYPLAHIAVLSVLVFEVLMRARLSERISKLLNFLGSLVFGIYLIHPPILARFMDIYSSMGISSTSFAGAILGGSSTLMVSMILIYVLKFTPLKKLI